MHDVTALLPLNQQDVIWLEVADQVEEERKLSEIKADWECRKAFSLILQDIRLIALNLIPFKSDMAFKDFLTTLPSYDGDAKKAKEDNRWKVKKRKPGEVPEWKKKRLAELANDKDKK